MKHLTFLRKFKFKMYYPLQLNMCGLRMGFPIWFNPWAAMLKINFLKSPIENYCIKTLPECYSDKTYFCTETLNIKAN